MRNKVCWIVLGLVLSIHFYNFGAQRLYPFLDMPNHLALARIYSSYGSPDNRLVQYYDLRMFPKPNVLHAVFCASKIFPGVDAANKVFYLAYVISFMAGVMLLIARCGGNMWYGLLAFLLLYNINVCYGFAGFTMALPAMLFLLYLLIDYIERNSAVAAAAIAVLLPLVFFMHAMAFLFALTLCVSCVLVDVCRSGSWRRVFPVLALCAPGALLFCVWYSADSREYNGPSMLQSLLHYYLHGFLGSFWQRGAVMVHDNFRLSGTVPGYVAAAAFSSVILFFAVYAFRQIRKRGKQHAATGGCACVLAFLACSTLCACLVPVALPGYSFLYQRFSVFVFLGIILASSCFAPGRLPAGMRVLLVLTIACHAAAWFDCFRDFDAENAGFDRTFFAGCSEDDVMAGLIYDCRFRNVSVYNNFPDYYTAWTAGISVTRMVDERSFVIRRKVGTGLMPEHIEWLGRGAAHQYDGRYAAVDYLLVRGEIPAPAREMLENFRVVNRAGAWRLYANSQKAHNARVPGR